jgi:hypothetical protein
MSGVIEGGWEYVIGAYAVSAATLLASGISLYLRWRAEERRSGRAADDR